MLTRLINNGYTKKDIVELCELYELQLDNFVNLINNLNDSELADELHKLKGGASILALDNSVQMLSELNDTNGHVVHTKLIIDTVTEVKNDLESLKQSAMNLK